MVVAFPNCVWIIIYHGCVCYVRRVVIYTYDGEVSCKLR